MEWSVSDHEPDWSAIKKSESVAAKSNSYTHPDYSAETSSLQSTVPASVSVGLLAITGFIGAVIFFRRRFLFQQMNKTAEEIELENCTSQRELPQLPQVENDSEYNEIIDSDEEYIEILDEDIPDEILDMS